MTNIVEDIFIILTEHIPKNNTCCLKNSNTAKASSNFFKNLEY